MLSPISAYAIEVSEEYLKALIEETKALHKEARELRVEVTQLKKQLVANKAATPAKSAKQTRPAASVPVKPLAATPAKSTPPPVTSVPPVNSDDIYRDASVLKPKPTPALPFINAPIYLAPSLGLPPPYNGSQLLTNISQTNSDLMALQFRQSMVGNNQPGDYYLVLSGSLNAQVSTMQPYIDDSQSDIDLTGANITALAGIGKWVTGFLSLDFDNLPPDGLNPPQIGPRYLNSRIYLDQGFITIGNLDAGDAYASIGQMYLPFGQYDGFAINSPLTSSLFTTIERPILLGYSQSNDTTEFDLEFYGYQGETTVTSATAINEWGASADYYLNKNNWNANVGFGYISNIADSEGMQINGQYAIQCDVFGGFAYPCNNGESLVHKVPGFDTHGSFTYGPFSVISEYITATRHFDRGDLGFNRHGARPAAFDVEAGLQFKFLKKPSIVSVGYGYTKEALALLLPAKQYVATVSTSLWRNTTQSLSFEHDVNYGRTSEAGGQGLPVYFKIDRINLGKSSNTVLFAINASF
ncbi:LbtU family siderophore porin [Legionella dresdenensis]